MNSTVLYNIARFLLLLAAQILIFDVFNFAGYLNPFPYVLFIILYPVNGNRYGLLLSAFLMGLIVDHFLNSGGVHATASIVLAYLRPSFFRFSFGVSYEYQTIKINERLTPERFSFILICVAMHHLVLFVLEAFRASLFLKVLAQTFTSTIFTLLICLLLIHLFKPTRR